MFDFVQVILYYLTLIKNTFVQTVFVVGDFPVKMYKFKYNHEPTRDQIIKRLESRKDWDVNCDVHMGNGFWY
jgi:hypothetical protein